MLNEITLSHLLFCLPLALLLFFVIQFVVLPFQRLNSYKQSGVKTSFFPLIGFWRYMQIRGQMSLEELKKTSNDSKVLLTNHGKTTLILLKDPAYKKEFFNKQNIYHKAEPFTFLTELVGYGLVFAEDDAWKLHRKIISASFHYDFLKSNMGLIQNTTKEILDNITPQEYQNLSIIQKAEQITGEIVGRLFFGERLNAYNFEGKPLTLGLADLLVEFTFVGMTPLVALFGRKSLSWSFIPKHKRVMQRVKEIRRICFNIIEARKAQNSHSTNDLLASLLATQQDPNPKRRMSDKDIVDEFITFFIAGMDTTGHLAGMSLYNLQKHPEILKEVRKEIEEIYCAEECVSAETLQKMDIVHSVLKETLRLYSPVPALPVRIALQDHDIQGFPIKKGDYVSAELAASGFDEVTFEEPEKFKPWRWRNKKAEKLIDPYAFAPFSAGPRNCIGQHLAIMEAKVILAEFIKRFDFSQDEGYKLEMQIKPVYGPKEDILFQLSPIIP